MIRQIRQISQISLCILLALALLGRLSAATYSWDTVGGAVTDSRTDSVPISWRDTRALCRYLF
jgi:hypothetical protein